MSLRKLMIGILGILLFLCSSVAAQMSIATIKSDGTDGTAIYYMANNYISMAHWSPDLTKVVLSARDGSTGYFEIFYYDLITQNLCQLTDYGHYYGQGNPRFLNDTTIWYRYHISGAGHSELAEIVFDDCTVLHDSVLTDFYSIGKQSDGFDLSTNYICLYVQSNSDSRSGDLYLVSLDSLDNLDNYTNLTGGFCSSCREGEPDISPDETKIIFDHDKGMYTTNNIYVMNIDGTDSTQLTSLTGLAVDNNVWYPLWSPDMTEIAYTYWDGSQNDIWIMNAADTSEKRNITNTPEYDEVCTEWIGNELLYTTTQNPDTLYIREVTTCLERYGQFSIPVRYKNLTETKVMNIPIRWDNPDVSFLGLSTDGTVCEDWWDFCNYDNDSQWVYFGLVDTGGATIPPNTDTVIGYLIFESNNPTSENCGPMTIHFDTTFSDNEERALAFGDASQPSVEFFPIIEFDTAYIDNYIAGDASRDGNRNIFDISFLISYLYLSGPAPICMNSADPNGDCTINIFDITYLICYLYGDCPELVCGCIEGSSIAKSYAYDFDNRNQVTSGEINQIFENGKTVITLNNSTDIMAMELTIKSVDGSEVAIYNRLDGYQLYGQQTTDLFKGALIDISGRNIIKSGEHVVLEIDGEVEIESVIAADIHSQPVYFDINNSSKESGYDLLPSDFALYQNQPNPFNPVTSISFSLPKASYVELAVYNVTGQRVKMLADGYYEAGVHTIKWDAGDVASGIYFYRIKAGEFVASKKMMLLK